MSATSSPPTSKTWIGPAERTDACTRGPLIFIPRLGPPPAEKSVKRPTSPPTHVPAPTGVHSGRKGGLPRHDHLVIDSCEEGAVASHRAEEGARRRDDLIPID